MYQEIRIFFTALMFYTRIPCPKWVDHDPIYMKNATRYFSLIGWIVGGLSALVFWICNHFFSVEISLVLAMAASIRITGAFHEDGLADVADGFGGGWTQEKILLIMKDSRLGTFGVVSLILILGLKFLSLREVPVEAIPFVIICGNALSRMNASFLLYRGKYIQNNNSSKAGSAAHKLSVPSLIVNLIFGLSSLLLLYNFLFLVCLIPLLITERLMYRFYKKWIGGYNGDCAGAIQQVSEVVFYLSLLVIWKYI